jgi:hypothetical protein
MRKTKNCVMLQSQDSTSTFVDSIMSRLDSEVMFYEGLIKKKIKKKKNSSSTIIMIGEHGTFTKVCIWIFFRFVFTEDIEDKTINCRSFS